MTTIPPAEFITVMTNFIDNVKNTFPEYVGILTKWCSNMEILWAFCKKKYLPRREDILSKNTDIFEDSSEVDTEFLPHIHFKNIWQDDGLSETNKDAIWGYLKLTLLSVDSENIDLDEAFDQVQELFKNVAVNECPSEVDVPSETPTLPDLSSMEGIFGGVLGNIAKDLAEDMVSNPDFSLEGINNVEDAMKRVFSDPSKLTHIFTSVSEKIDSKLTSGELNNADIMRETTTLMSKMKDIPGMADGLSGLFGNSNNTGGGGARNSNLSNKDKINK